MNKLVSTGLVVALVISLFACVLGHGIASAKSPKPQDQVKNFMSAVSGLKVTKAASYWISEESSNVSAAMKNVASGTKMSFSKLKIITTSQTADVVIISVTYNIKIKVKGKADVSKNNEQASFNLNNVNNIWLIAGSTIWANEPWHIPALTPSITSALPGYLLTINGSGFDATADTSIRFSAKQGFSVEIPAIDVTATAITVPVPPVIDYQSGKYVPGTVDVQLIRKSGPNIVTTDVISGFQIKDLPNPAWPAGTVTLSFLTGELELARQNQNRIKGTSLDTTELNSALNTQISNMEMLTDRVQKMVQDGSVKFDMGTMGGQSAILQSSDLLSADRAIIGMLAAQANLNSTTKTSSLLDRFLTFTGLYAKKAFGDDAFNVVPYYNAAVNGGSDLQLRAGSYFAGQSQSGPNAFNISYKVVGASAGIALGILSLLGAPAAALALPSAALLYVTLLGGGGQIAVGAALHNLDVPGAMQLIQDGVKRVDDKLTATLKSLLLPGGTLGTIRSLINNTMDLSEQFISPLKPQPSPTSTEKPTITPTTGPSITPPITPIVTPTTTPTITPSSTPTVTPTITNTPTTTPMTTPTIIPTTVITATPEISPGLSAASDLRGTWKGSGVSYWVDGGTGQRIIRITWSVTIVITDQNDNTVSGTMTMIRTKVENLIQTDIPTSDYGPDALENGRISSTSLYFNVGDWKWSFTLTGDIMSGQFTTNEPGKPCDTKSFNLTRQRN